MAKEVKNKFGVKVGDLFAASWGYEQTNYDFFQVIKLVGDSSVRVREVNPPLLREENATWGSADRTYLNDGSILPPADFSVFIKDQEKGDLKRLKSYRQDGTCPQFKISSYADASYCEPGEIKTYESWWY
jgi:hypothetical protein